MSRPSRLGSNRCPMPDATTPSTRSFGSFTTSSSPHPSMAKILPPTLSPGFDPNPVPRLTAGSARKRAASCSKRCPDSGVSVGTEASSSVRVAPEEPGQPVVQRSDGGHRHLGAEGPPALLVAAKLRLQALLGPVERELPQLGIEIGRLAGGLGQVPAVD